MKGNLGNLLKQAQKMQADMQKAQEELGSVEVTGQSGGGLVSVVMTARYNVRRVQIDPSLVSGDDRDMLEDLIGAAFNDAIAKVEKTIQDKFSGMASGMGLPPGFKMPF